ncbi:hypothetical protein P1X14_03600 [Sphingomonas sp. AOB5]|uniref:hypothetical protein n=1 Tax=Sphingomonas sp. AOB5 TaxID=3034017 RepID=UPI0023F622DF|nr:hypothetical protein [Sphingomonas sp. AOB5]MDF7774322.1 hypothetical protein [Sphingomonas sp. AOB5]
MHERIFTRSDRESMNARVWPAGAPAASVHEIRTLTMCGACLDHDGELQMGANTRVSIGGLANVPAIVTWVREGRAGIRFDYPIDLIVARRGGLAAA